MIKKHQHRFRTLFEQARNVLAVIGLISIVVSIGLTLFIFRHYSYSPGTIGRKVLEKSGLANTGFAKVLKPASMRPAGLHFPPQGSDRWAGAGAVTTRELMPVIYFRKNLPVPRQWHTIAGLSPVSVQRSKRQVNVENSVQFIRALKKAAPGDMIVLKPGVYPVRAYNININHAGTAEMPICVRAQTLGQVRIELDTLEGFLINAPYWIFENLEIKGVRKNHGSQEHAFHVIGKGRSFVLRNSRVHEFNAIIKANGTGGSGGKTLYPDNVLIENNTFYNSEVRRTSKPVTFIDVVGASHWIVRGNFISDFAKGEGDKISYAAFFKGNSSGCIFENNLVIGEYRHTGGVRVGLSFGGGGTGKKFFRNGRTDVEHSHGIIRNNVVMYCPDVAVYLNKAADTKIYNNTFYKTMGIDVRFRASTAVIKNNLMTGRIKDRDGGTSVRENNVVVSGKSWLKKGFQSWFQNPDKGDFSLKSGGPFIDKAQLLPEIYEDICGNPRPSNPDIGAYEYNTGTICRLIGEK